jgi:hypothetical protein
VAFPAPALPIWGLGLVAFALAVIVLGELARTVGARWLPLLRVQDPIERGLLDLYLGGGVFYVLAAVPLPIFYPDTVSLTLVLGAGGLVLLLASRRDRLRTRVALGRLLAPLQRPEYVVALVAALGLFAIELWAIAGVGSGNTYDSSLLSTYTSLLLAHHTLPLSLSPVANQGLSYPQATTVWLAVGQSLFGLPPLRTSLLVTPLFLAIAPLGAFGLGRRLGGSATVGVAFALVLTLLAAWSRGMVEGSNDFVFALPLVLLLSGWSIEWARGSCPPLATAVAFGGLAGYAAAMNPVGPIWLLLALPVFAGLSRPAFGGSPFRWITRWVVATAAALVAVLPSLYALVRSPGSAGFAPTGGTLTVTSGESVAQFVGFVDPFLFGAQDQSLSPFPLLRAELALLLVVGVLLLALGRERFAVPADLGRFLLAGSAVATVLLGLGVLAHAGVPPFSALFRVVSPRELSILLFAQYSLVAGVPLAVAIGQLGRRAAGIRSPDRRGPRRQHDAGWVLPALVTLVIVLPGVAVTSAQLPSELHEGYTTFSNLTQADVDLLEWSAAHLADGSRVIVGPGSAAEFLPGYDPRLVILYPMTVGFLSSEPVYWSLVDGLQNGTLNSSALADLYIANGGSEHPFYVAVTENNTALFRPMLPGPLLQAEAPIAFHEGGVYLFRWTVPVGQVASAGRVRAR